MINKLKDKIKQFNKLKIFNINIMNFMFMINIVGILGFIIENTFRLFTAGIIDARFQRLPCIYIYGLAVGIVYIVIGIPSKFRFFKYEVFKNHLTLRKISYFMFTFIMILIFESLFGLIFFKLTGKDLWNYSNIFLHLGKYTSVPTTFGLSLFVYIFMEYIYMFIIKRLDKVKANGVIIFNYTIGVLFIIDFIITCILLLSGNATMLWKIKLF